MKTYTVHWTYNVVSVPVENDWEVFITFYPEPAEDSLSLPLTEECIEAIFFPEILGYIREWGCFDKAQKPQDVIRQVAKAGKLEETLCSMLNFGPTDYKDIVRPLENEAYKQWKKIHAD